MILGYTDLAGRLPTQASQLYGTNLVNLVKLLTPGKDGQLVLDFDDVVQRSVTVVRDGESTWPPPPVQVSAAPAAASVAPAVAPPPAKRTLSPATPQRAGRRSGIAVLFAVCAIAPAPLPQHFTVLVLSVVVGFYVIGKVHHALHTPLMSVTNAISGIIIVGAMVQITSAAARRAGARRDRGAAGEHQHLRRLRGDPAHARDVPPRRQQVIAADGTAVYTARADGRRHPSPAPPTSSRRCCSS